MKVKKELRKPCIFPGCIKFTASNYGLCNPHYNYQYRRKKRNEIKDLTDVENAHLSLNLIIERREKREGFFKCPSCGVRSRL